MIKTLKVLALAAAAALLAAPYVLADAVEVKVSVPFEFVAGDTVLPSGEYHFVTTEGSHDIVQVHTAKGEHVATVLCRPLPAGSAENTVVSFDKLGDQRFLKSIRIGDGSGMYLPTTAFQREKQAQARAKAAAAAAVAAR
jgi:hypothetical protein